MLDLCFIIGATRPRVERFCHEEGVDVKSKQIIACTPDTFINICSGIDPERATFVFLADWGLGLTLNRIESILYRVNQLCLRSKDPEKRIIRDLPAWFARQKDEEENENIPF